MNVVEALRAAKDTPRASVARPLKKLRPALAFDEKGGLLYWSPPARSWFAAPHLQLPASSLLEPWEIVSLANAERDRVSAKPPTRERHGHPDIFVGAD